MMRSNSKMSALIDEYVNSERNRAILKKRFIDGYTFAQIAERYEMSEAQISRIVHRYGDPLLLMLDK